jgi:hypothetical protein
MHKDDIHESCTHPSSTCVWVLVPVIVGNVVAASVVDSISDFISPPPPPHWESFIMHILKTHALL